MSQTEISADQSIEDKTPAKCMCLQPRQLLVAIAVVAVTSIFSVQTPARIKLLAVFPIALGWLMGALINTILAKDGEQVSRGMKMFAAILVMVGLGFSTWVTFIFEDFRAVSKSSTNDRMARNLIERMKQATDIAPANESPPKSKLKTTVEAFQKYLARRVSQLGRWASPWPEAFWLFELIAGGIAATIGIQFHASRIPSLTANKKASP